MSTDRRSAKEIFAKMIGRTLTLANGKKVKVESLSHSFRYRKYAVVNEKHFIDYLSLFAQFFGETVDPEDRETWENLDKSPLKKR